MQPSRNPERIGWLAAAKLVREHGHTAHKGWNAQGDMCLCVTQWFTYAESNAVGKQTDHMPLDDANTVCLQALRRWLGY